MWLLKVKVWFYNRYCVNCERFNSGYRVGGYVFVDCDEWKGVCLIERYGNVMVRVVKL